MLQLDCQMTAGDLAAEENNVHDYFRSGACMCDKIIYPRQKTVMRLQYIVRS